MVIKNSPHSMRCVDRLDFDVIFDFVQASPTIKAVFNRSLKMCTCICNPCNESFGVQPPMKQAIDLVVIVVVFVYDRCKWKFVMDFFSMRVFLLLKHNSWLTFTVNFFSNI